MEDLYVIILAGGKGLRLDPLTRFRSKPAVPFAGNSRIIDFPLSEAMGSLAPNILVLTQFQSTSLERHVNDYFRPHTARFHTVDTQAPREKLGERNWYQGTAGAILHNWDIIERTKPSRIAVLSGDHIYNRFSLEKFLRFHDETGGDLTIAANRKSVDSNTFEVNNQGKLVYPYGVILTEDNGRVTGFEEKPECPSSDLASMGIYIFNTNALRNWLSDERVDFGKHLIPAMHKAKRPIHAYIFEGYWADVGSRKAYFEANLALNSDNPPLNMHELSRHQRTEIMGGSYKPASKVPLNGAYSTVSEGCEIHRDAVVKNCVLSPGTRIGPNAVLRDCIILGASDNAYTGECDIKDCVLERAIVDRGNYLRGMTVRTGSPETGFNPDHEGDKYVVDKDAGITVITRKAYSAPKQNLKL